MYNVYVKKYFAKHSEERELFGTAETIAKAEELRNNAFEKYTDGASFKYTVTIEKSEG